MHDDRPHIQIQALTAPNAIGGGSAHAQALGTALQQAGAHTALLSVGSPPRGPVDGFDELHCVPPPSGGRFWRLHPWPALPYWRQVIRRTTRETSAIIALSPALALAARWARPDLPRIYTPAAVPSLEPGGGWFVRQADRQALRSASGLLLTTPAVRTAVEQIAARLTQPIRICPLGVAPPGATTRSRAFLGIPRHVKLLLTIGTLCENKGQLRIARALQQLREPEWHWVVVGSGPCRAALLQAVRTLGIESRVRLITEDHHLEDWYATADAVVTASQCETFGLTIAEALRAGRPVILPADEPGHVLSPLAAFVTRHDVGRTYRRDDPQDLADVIGAALANDGWRQRAGRDAAALAAEAFSWQRYAETALQLLDDCTATASSGCVETTPGAPVRP